MRPSARDLGRKLKLLRYGVRPTRLKPLDGGGREGTGSGAQHSLVLVRWFAGGDVCRARYCNCSCRRGRGERGEGRGMSLGGRPCAIALRGVVVGCG
jgi:hypothetical protein